MKWQQRIAVAAAIGLLVAPTVIAGQAPATQDAPRKLISPVRGEATVDYTKPNTRVRGREVVTVIVVKNTSQKPIAGFKLEESWIDKSGTLSGGDTYRHTKPFMPGEVITVTLTTPRNDRMSSNSYNFTHANGTIKPTAVAKIEIPTT